MIGTDLASGLTKEELMVIEFMKALLANSNSQVGSDPAGLAQLAMAAAQAVIAATQG